METGLRKLDEASRSVAILKKELAVTEQELAQASEKAESVSRREFCLNSEKHKILYRENFFFSNRYSQKLRKEQCKQKQLKIR